MSFFDIDKIFFTVLGYPLSYLEFFATLTGFIAVWLSAKANIWSWPIGIINVTLFFFLAYQVQLYPDMFLQIFFFVTNILGWWRWTHPKNAEADKKHELRVSLMPTYILIIYSLGTLMASVGSGAFASKLHEWFPVLFNKPSAFPYLDSFVMVASITTTFLMVQKKIECWAGWIIINLVATYLYFSKGLLFVSIEYFAFFLIAIFGLWSWREEYKSYTA